MLLSRLRPPPPGPRYEEGRLIETYLRGLQPSNRFFVDIGAEGGLFASNTYRLARDGWAGLGVEMDPAQFRALAAAWADSPGVALARAKATPETVVPLLGAFSVPPDFAFLSLDIDGYDWHVLARILTRYRPRLVCAEVNETVPPPVRFAVDYAPDYAWDGGPFFGMSLSALGDLAARHGYALLGLHYNNAFLAPAESSPFPALGAAEAYRVGYEGQPDRDVRFGHNLGMTHRFGLHPDALLADVRRGFAAYEGRYMASLTPLVDP